MKSLIITLFCLTVLVCQTKAQEQNANDKDVLEERLKSQNEKPSVYPNPSTGTFTIKLGDKVDENATVKIYNEKGQLVVEEVLGESKTELLLEGYEKGIYWILVTQSKQTYSLRLEVL